MFNIRACCSLSSLLWTYFTFAPLDPWKFVLSKECIVSYVPSSLNSKPSKSIEFQSKVPMSNPGTLSHPEIHLIVSLCLPYLITLELLSVFPGVLYFNRCLQSVGVFPHDFQFSVLSVSTFVRYSPSRSWESRTGLKIKILYCTLQGDSHFVIVKDLVSTRLVFN